MAFTQITVTGTYDSSANGSVTFTLTQPMANSDEIASVTPIVATVAAGALSQVLNANTDPTTVPQGVVYGVTEVLTGYAPRDYFIEVPAVVTETNGSTTAQSKTVVLASVTPELWMVGLPISGTNIPTNSTISAVDQAHSTVTISNAATGTGTGLSFTIGSSTIDISTLMPGETEWQ